MALFITELSAHQRRTGCPTFCLRLPLPTCFNGVMP